MMRLEDEVAAVGMRGDVVQHFAEVGELLGLVLLAGAVEVVDERLHAVEAGFVERLQDVERGEEERAGAAGRVEDGDRARWRARRRGAAPALRSSRSRPGRTGGCRG